MHASKTIMARRVSWGGVIAGLLMGLVVVMAMAALALFLGSFLSLDLRGAGITAGIYTIVTALVSAYVAGFFAVKYSAPESLFVGENGSEIHPNTASLTGMLTAAAIIFVTTFFTMSTTTSILGTAGRATTSAISGTANAVGSVVSGVASTTGTVVGGGAVAAAQATPNGAFQQQIDQIQKQINGKVNRDEIEAMLAKNIEGISKQQVTATANVLEDMIKDTKNEVASFDFTNVDTWKNLDDYAKTRFAEIEKILKGPEFVQRLQAEGLTEAQAQKVRDEVINTYAQYKQKSEQLIQETKQKIDEAKQKLDEAMQKAEEAARQAALYAGLFWLISAGLTFAASIFGAKSAAKNYLK